MASPAQDLNAKRIWVSQFYFASLWFSREELLKYLSRSLILGCSEKGISQNMVQCKKKKKDDWILIKTNFIIREKWIAQSTDTGGTVIHLGIIKVSECCRGRGFELEITYEVYKGTTISRKL